MTTDVTEPTHVTTIRDAAEGLAHVVAAYERGVDVALDHIGGMSGEDVRLALLAAAAVIADLRRDRDLPPMPAEPPACGQEYPGSGGGCVMRPDHGGPCYGPEDVGSDLPAMPAGSEAPPEGGTANPGRWTDPRPRR